jgi:hypothetical protein
MGRSYWSNSSCSVRTLGILCTPQACVKSRFSASTDRPVFNLQRGALWRPSQCSHLLIHAMVCLWQCSSCMIEELRGLLGKFLPKNPKKRTPSAKPKATQNSADFRAVVIAPSIICCAAAMDARDRPYLLRAAPRLPLYGCTMPTTCSCKFRKDADRRDSDRRLFGAMETNRWFIGVESRKRASRRSADQ